MLLAGAIGRTLALRHRSMPLFGSEDILAPPDRPHWYHHAMTVRAATEAGWSPPAAEELAWHCVGVDLYCSHPVWWVRGGPARVHGARMGKIPLHALHFDSLRDTADIVEIRRRIEGGVLVGLLWAAGTQDVLAARNIIGVGLHALQDFYSHSTWVDASSRRDLTWNEQLERTGKPPEHLVTSSSGPVREPRTPPHGDVRPSPAVLTRLPAMLLGDPWLRGSTKMSQPHGDNIPRPPKGLRCTGPAGINLDSRWQARTGVRVRGLRGIDGDEAFDIAVRLAVRESRTFLQTIEEHLHSRGDLERFWSLVRSAPAHRWTDAFDDPHRQALWFLTAGAYPPRGRRDAVERFIRVLVTAPRTPASHVPVALTRPVRTFVLRALDGGGRALTEWRCPYGRAGAVGPLPAETAFVAVAGVDGPITVDLHAFVRHPQPSLVELADGVRAEGPVRFPLRA